MKTIFSLIAATLISFTAAAQTPAYTLQSVALGTNAIPANFNLALPLVLSTYTVTNIGVGAYFYLATNSATNTVKFTIPTTNTLSFTNTFIESNAVVGISTKSWTVNELVLATNTTVYYTTNASYITYSNGLPILTNSATYKTNYQIISLLTPVPFSITGTNSSTVNYTNYGASVIDARQSASVAVKVGFNLTGAGTGPVTFSYVPNIDSVIDTNIPQQTFTLAAKGTAIVATNVSITLGPLGYAVFTAITNGNSVAVTNLFFKYAQKVNSP